MRIFLDTSFFIARFDERDQYHKMTISFLRDMTSGRRPFKRIYTSNYVLDESVTFTLYRTKSHRTAETVLDAITNSEYIKVLYVTEEVQEKANALFKKYHDHLISMTDCTSAVLMKENGIDTIFTFDCDFKSMGFKVVP